MDKSKWSGVVVRKTFLDFFAERGHTIGTPQLPDSSPQSQKFGYGHAWLLWSFLYLDICLIELITTVLPSALVVGRPAQ
jgi:hypothetical protein